MIIHTLESQVLWGIEQDLAKMHICVMHYLQAEEGSREASNTHSEGEPKRG